MLCSALRALFRRADIRSFPAIPTPELPSAPVTAPAGIQPLPWSPTRLALNDQLWGPGFIFPGGETETVHLAKPIGISASGSLLLVGVGSGGPAGAITQNLGAWVTGRESDPHLLNAARSRTARDRFGHKVALSPWDPDNPVFDDRKYHHCLALDPLRRGHAEPILHGLTQAVRRGGHLVISGVAAEQALDPDEPTVARWAALDGRSARLVPTRRGVTRMLGRLGFDVRIEEDITHRHTEQAMIGWRVLLSQLREKRPDRDMANSLMREAELWLLRRRLLKEGRLRMMRWHAISRPAAATE